MTTAQMQRLVDEQNTVWQRMQDIQTAAETENRDLTAEERQNWDQAETRLTEVSGDIERLNRMAQLSQIDRGQIAVTTGEPEGRRGGDQEEQARRYTEAFSVYLRGGMDRLTSDQRNMLMDQQVDLRAMGAGIDTAGGFTVPDEFRNIMTETMKAFGGLLNLADIVPTSTGADLPWPTNDDTGNEGELLGENVAAGEQDLSLGGRKLKAFTFSSKQVRLSLQLLQDSAFNLETWVPKKLGERIGRRAARSFTTGTGVDQPEGLTTSAAVGKTGASGQTTSVIYDDLVDLEHSVDSAYRANARYLMHDSTLKVIRKLKDSQQRPLWVPIPAPGFPATINGFEYSLDNSMPIPAASAKTIAFGDFKAGYVIRQVQSVQTLRLVERYAEYLQVAFLGFARMDGMIQDPSAVRTYQHAAS
ncbi:MULTISPECIES: phage major capsid protein [Streptomyces]|uniref:phage major capsid protein n=1 Tax=Streptomyces TaxID=1883 RepID=UPI0029A794A5|nr:phage major capsid protein [Streptomyces stelliscabiei]MDX2520587.1 phage major capsid protein [Streptomyces stelliscabiei]MDX2552684.1 phage major capsid protein [Streptomyces stelliscabiei]MDX2661368.1 phage major capsid protein [Streptomyces stelliscabiei]MDX2788849.1 phage major capsid protein [Streptomyces stelliscabiei]